MEEEIRGEQARQREQSALLELSQLKGTPMQPAKSTPMSWGASPMNVRTPGGGGITPLEKGLATEVKRGTPASGMASLFSDSPDTPGKRLVYDTPEVEHLRRKGTTDGGSLSANRVHEMVGKFEGSRNPSMFGSVAEEDT